MVEPRKNEAVDVTPQSEQNGERVAGEKKERLSRRSRRRVYPRSFWQQLVDERKREGLTFAQSAARHGVSESAITRWARKLGQQKTRTPPQPKTTVSSWVEIPNAQTTPLQVGYTITHPSGVSVTTPSSVDVATVVSLASDLMKAL